jgi:hypothetical protein
MNLLARLCRIDAADRFAPRIVRDVCRGCCAQAANIIRSVAVRRAIDGSGRRRQLK